MLSRSASEDHTDFDSLTQIENTPLSLRQFYSLAVPDDESDAPSVRAIGWRPRVVALTFLKRRGLRTVLRDSLDKSCGNLSVLDSRILPEHFTSHFFKRVNLPNPSLALLEELCLDWLFHYTKEVNPSAT